eukprot:13806931-Alexandrium_andersonii.AAC.1
MVARLLLILLVLLVLLVLGTLLAARLLLRRGLREKGICTHGGVRLQGAAPRSRPHRAISSLMNASSI